MISITEAVKLSDQIATFKDLEWANELLSYYNANPPRMNDFRARAAFVLSVAFAAGRVQGIREERSRHHESRSL